jgi:Tol biopolymer transport system component
VPAVAGIAQALNSGDALWDTAAGQFSISVSGSLVHAPGGILPDPENSLVWVDHNGKPEPIASFKAPFIAPSLSPNGQRIAYRTLGMKRHVWVYDVNRGTATKLTSDGMASFVTWTPDSSRVVFGWGKTGDPNIYWQPVDGSGPMERLTQSEYNQFPGSWSPDGETLAFVEYHPDTDTDIQRIRNFHPTGGGWPMCLTSQDAERYMFSLSPEGEASGRYRIGEASSLSGLRTANNCSIAGETRSGSWMSKPDPAFPQASRDSCLNSPDTITVLRSVVGTSRVMDNDS